jgi:hypothetical protein
MDTIGFFLSRTNCLPRQKFPIIGHLFSWVNYWKFLSRKTVCPRQKETTPKFSHMTNLLCALYIFDIRVLQYKFKLSFLKRVNDHPLTKQTFEFLHSKFNVCNNKSSSLLLNCNLETLLKKNCLIPLKNYVLNIDNEFKQGIVDSIKTCLSNYKELFFLRLF